MPLRARQLHARAAARRGVRGLRPPPAEAAAASPAVKLLVVKLADLGDALTATPALRALRSTWPEADIDVLTSPAGAAALGGLDSVSRLWVADKHRFDTPLGVLSPSGLHRLLPLLATLRRRRYDKLLLLHHLTTPFGTVKYALLAGAVAARATVGLDNGRGWFLSARAADAGFGAHHEVDYALQVAAAAGATRPAEPRLELALDPASRSRAAALLDLPAPAAPPHLAAPAAPRLDPALDLPGRARDTALPDLAAPAAPRLDPGLDPTGRSRDTSLPDLAAPAEPRLDPALDPTGRSRDTSPSDLPAAAAPRLDPALDLPGRSRDTALPDLPAAAARRLDPALDLPGHSRDTSLPDHAARPRPAGSLWIALHAGGGSYSLARRWPPAAFAAVGRMLVARTGARLAVVGGDDDLEPSRVLVQLLEGDVLDLVAKTSVKETAAVLERCRLLISNDSGVVHLAAAVGTPVVAIFGPSNHRAWGPYPPGHHRVARVSLPCSPCFYRGYGLGTPQGCPTRDCLRLLTPAMVAAAAESLLQTGRG